METTTFDETMEFTLWLRRNGNKLRGYAPNDIAVLARTCGFNLELVCRDVGDHVTHLQRLLRFYDSPLNEQWIDLFSYQRRGVTREDN